MHNGKPSRKLEEKITDNVLETIKQGSKLLYRLLKTVLSVFSLKFAFLMVKVSWWDGLNGLVMAKMMGGVEGLNAAASKQFMSSYNTFKKPLIQASVLPVILNLIEKAFIKGSVNTDYFDNRRRAGSYPNIRLRFFVSVCKRVMPNETTHSITENRYSENRVAQLEKQAMFTFIQDKLESLVSGLRPVKVASKALRSSGIRQKDIEKGLKNTPKTEEFEQLQKRSEESLTNRRFTSYLKYWSQVNPEVGGQCL